MSVVPKVDKHWVGQRVLRYNNKSTNHGRKTKVGKSDFINIINLGISKDAIKKMKIQVVDWENIFKSCILMKGFYLEYIKCSCGSTVKIIT